jgi:hypothetical protein
MDQVPRTQVLGQQDFPGPPLERAEVFRVHREPGGLVAQALDLLGMSKAFLAVVVDHQPGHRRVPSTGGGLVVQPGDYVGQPPHVLLPGPHDRYAEQARKMLHIVILDARVSGSAVRAIGCPDDCGAGARRGGTWRLRLR